MVMLGIELLNAPLNVIFNKLQNKYAFYTELTWYLNSLVFTVLFLIDWKFN